MKRITRLCKDTENGNYIKHTAGNFIGVYPGGTLGEVVERLAYYEDLEEQGKLKIFGIEKEQYKKENPLYSSAIPSLQTKCPVNYNWETCSSSEYGYTCRGCGHYNPLRMLYELENGTKVVVPKDVLLDDCKVQLEKG